jgi:hypothetical protein
MFKVPDDLFMQLCPDGHIMFPMPFPIHDPSPCVAAAVSSSNGIVKQNNGPGAMPRPLSVNCGYWTKAFALFRECPGHLPLYAAPTAARQNGCFAAKPVKTGSFGDEIRRWIEVSPTRAPCAKKAIDR